MDQLSASLSFSEEYLALGGSIELVNFEEQLPLAALALVDLMDDQVLFAKRFGMAEAITAISVRQENHDVTLVALAVADQQERESLLQAFIIVVDATGALAMDPILLPERALNGVGSPDFYRASMLFDADHNTIVALGHDENREFMTILTSMHD